MSKIIWVTYHHILEEEFSAMPLSEAQMLHCHTLFSLNIVALIEDIWDSRSSFAEDLVFPRHGSVTHWQDINSKKKLICLDRAVFSALQSEVTYKLPYVCGFSRVLRKWWYAFSHHTVHSSSQCSGRSLGKKSQCTVYKTRRQISEEDWPWKEPEILSAFLLVTHPTVRTCNFPEPVCCLVTSS